jgi:SAM-dependent methyltransferase
MKVTKTDIESIIAEYYSDKVLRFGATPQGVDWKDKNSQDLRFAQLIQVFEDKLNPVNVIDIGCGYGALYEYLKNQAIKCNYLGVDLSNEMIKVAREKFKKDSNTKFLNTNNPKYISDYVIASGIFNVKMNLSNDTWLDYVNETMRVFHKYSKIGFAFNFLSSFSDEDKRKDYLFYANPEYIQNLCFSHFGKSVEIIQGYGLYEFTVIVRKDK